MSNWAVVLGVGVVVLGTVGLLKAWSVLNVVETGNTPAYPDLLPRRYREGKMRVFDAALRAMDRLPRWQVISSRQEQGEIEAEARTRLLRFVDDVTVRVEERDDLTVVNVRSASRVGRGDFGQNARNVRAFFEELDRQMGSAERQQAPAQ
jgi:uncharacterized protein (DUF1499 family)